MFEKRGLVKANHRRSSSLPPENRVKMFFKGTMTLRGIFRNHSSGHSTAEKKPTRVYSRKGIKVSISSPILGKSHGQSSDIKRWLVTSVFFSYCKHSLGSGFISIILSEPLAGSESISWRLLQYQRCLKTNCQLQQAKNTDAILCILRDREHFAPWQSEVHTKSVDSFIKINVIRSLFFFGNYVYERYVTHVDFPPSFCYKITLHTKP